MADMKVGDVGVLQNLPKNFYLNGTPAEIIKVNPYPDIKLKLGGEVARPADYQVLDIEGDMPGIFKKHIRPLSDPDAAQPTEQDEELTV